MRYFSSSARNNRLMLLGALWRVRTGYGIHQASSLKIGALSALDFHINRFGHCRFYSLKPTSLLHYIRRPMS